MVPANSVTVPVAAGANHFQLVVAASYASRNRQRAAVQCMHAVSVHVARQIRRTTDAADDASLMRLQSQLKHRRLQCSQHRKIAAAGAPIGMDPAPISFFR